MKILLVDDDAPATNALRDALAAQGHSVRVDGDAARALATVDADVVLLSLDLPGTDGRAVCRRLRDRRAELPIVVLSAEADEVDRILGFESGADDYVVKPYSVREVVLRVRALARRTGIDGPVVEAQAVGSHVRIDRRARRVFLDGVEVHLTSKEFDILAYLCGDAGSALRRAEIIEHVWGGQWFGPTKTLDAHIAAIRRKLDGGLRITAIRGVGFRVDA